MNLNYVSIGLDYDLYIESQNELRFEFQQQVAFINDYISKAVRKLKFKTDGSFNMICIELHESQIKPCQIVSINVLKVELSFDKARYDNAKKNDDFGYYLDILEQGLKKASEFKQIPLDFILNLIENFKNNNFKNEWLLKKKKFKEQDLEVVLNCEYGSKYFQLLATINQLSTKKELTKGIIIQTETGVSIHEGMFKDIIYDNNIIITDSSDSPRIVINSTKVFNGELSYKILGNKELKGILSFELSK